MVVGIGTLVLLWLSIAISLSGIVRNQRPDLALIAWPNDGLTAAALSEREISARLDAASVERARQLATAALAAEPTSARAARMLATLTRDEAAARRGFLYSRRLSRRDLPTTLWFIEDAVSRNDAREALRQYDIALRTSSAAPILLFPILDASLSQPQLTQPIADLLATGSDEWVPQFIEYSISGRSNAAHLGRVLLHAPRALMRLAEADRASFVRQLVEQQHFDVAADLHRLLAGRPAQGALVSHGDFTAAGDWPPFDWAVVTTADYGAMVQEGALQAFAQGALEGNVARQLISLPPGLYRLRTTASLAPGSGSGGASWAVSCANPPANIATLDVRTIPGRAAASEMLFRVAPGCTWQWLRLDVRPAPGGARFDLLIDDVSIMGA